MGIEVWVLAARIYVDWKMPERMSLKVQKIFEASLVVFFQGAIHYQCPKQQMVEVWVLVAKMYVNWTILMMMWLMIQEIFEAGHEVFFLRVIYLLKPTQQMEIEERSSGVGLDLAWRQMYYYLSWKYHLLVL